MMSPAGFERGDQWNTISCYPPSNMILEFGASIDAGPIAYRKVLDRLLSEEGYAIRLSRRRARMRARA
jgi:hypothetical protein